MLLMILNERVGDDFFWRGAVACHALEGGGVVLSQFLHAMVIMSIKPAV